MQKILAIIWKELYITYTDRNLLVIMLATPLALALIISLAFSDLLSGSSDIPISNIPVAIVNRDQGVEMNGAAFNNGQTFINVLVPPANADEQTLADNALYQLTDAVVLSSVTEARAGVNNGTYAAAIIIPADFSERITYSQEHPTVEPASVEVYANPGALVSASIIHSIASSISNQIATGNIAIAATINALIERAQSDPAFGVQFGLISAAGGFQPDFAPAFSGETGAVAIERQTVEGRQVSFNPLVTFGSGQAVFFMLFTAMASANSLLEERRNWTLQRLIASPTPRYMVLLSKFVATFVTCVVQVLLLLVALTIIGSLLSGEFQIIWGTNILAILATVLVTALASAGLGVFVTSVVKTPEQGNVVGSLTAMAMGMIGGVFFSTQGIPVLGTLSRLTIIYWGVDAFGKLSVNRSDIAPNLIFLLLFGLVFFMAGWFIFNRRLNV